VRWPGASPGSADTLGKGHAGIRFADLVGGAIVVLLGLSIVLFSLQLPYTAEYSPGPGFLPLWLGVVIAVAGIVLLAQILRRRPGDSAPLFKPRAALGGKMLMLIVGTFLLLPLLGFAAGLGLFSAASMRWIGWHGWLLCGMTALATAIGIHYVLGTWLEIPLLTGIVGW
jgi:putative tricarboxylic transport membrane protein